MPLKPASAAEQCGALESRVEAVVRAFGDAALDAVVVTDLAGRIVHWSGLAESCFGWRADEVRGRTVSETLVPESYRALHDAALVRYASSGRSTVLGRTLRLGALCRDGREVPVELSVRRVEAGATPLFVAFLRDLSGETRALARTSEAEALASSVLASLDASVAVVGRDGTIVAVNDRWRRFAAENGADPDAVSVGASYLLACTRATGEEGSVAKQAHVGLLAVLDGVRDRFALEYACDAPDRPRWFTMVATPLQPPWKGAVVVHTDVTERRLMEDALRAPARSDPLTGLPNRLLFSDRLEQALLRRQRNGGRSAVLLVDLDRFKEVNDALGHAAGDALLCEVARRFQLALRKSDTVARFGGDELLVLLPEVRDGDAAAGVAQKLLDALDPPFAYEGHSLQAEASIGIVVAPEHGEDVATLLRRADIALHAAKRGRRAHALYVDDDAEHAAARRLSLVAELRSALRRRELLPVFQPIVEVGSGECTAVEVLARWQHPERGLLEPEDLVPLAERAGVVRRLSGWILGEAVRACSAWRAVSIGCGVVVRLAAGDFGDRCLPQEVGALLERWRLPSAMLTLAIDQRAGLPEPRVARDVLRELAELGIRLAIDDLGTGLARLGVLQRLPLREVKLPGTLLLARGTDPGADVVLRATVELARRLGLVVVAECVEQREHLELLAELGCERAQGSFISGPLREDELRAWLLERSRSAPVSGVGA